MDELTMMSGSECGFKFTPDRRTKELREQEKEDIH
jgi:hypothetical protein